jgi:septum formation protein
MDSMQPDGQAEIILASSSPRRRELLNLLGLSFQVLAPQLEEERLAGEKAGEYARRLARDKARCIHGTLSGDQVASAVVIAADTVVAVDDQVLGKPVDPAEACAMLRSLSGRAHQVFTGLALLGPATEYVTLVATDVEMKSLTDGEIEAYVATDEPMDKAGAYAIQGGAAFMVRSLNGSYTNVVGLPMAELEEALRELFGIQPFPHGKG